MATIVNEVILCNNSRKYAIFDFKIIVSTWRINVQQENPQLTLELDAASASSEEQGSSAWGHLSTRGQGKEQQEQKQWPR